MTTGTRGSGESQVELPGRSARLPEAPCKVRSALASHPLFEPPRIRRLLRTVPRRFVEVRAVQSAGDHDGSYRRGELQAGADPVEAFERLEERPTWILLHRTWAFDRDCAGLLADYVRGLAGYVEELRGGLSDLGCWLFLSSGRSVVHFHADPDQSVLNQIRGSKTVFVYPTAVLPEPAIERLAYTEQQGQAYRPEYEPAAFPAVHLSPGEGVFLPLYAPHRVVNDDAVCVSWNVGFHTRASRRRRKVHIVNHELRALGVEPSPYDRSPLRDSVKARMHLAVRVKNRLLGPLAP